MSDLWAAIDTTRSLSPRILVTNGGKEPILKARMSGPPHHRKALSTFLEALALWEGCPVRAALVVGARGGCDTSLYHDLFAAPDHTPMYSIDYVSSLAESRRLHRDRIEGMGPYHDLKQVLLFEVAR